MAGAGPAENDSTYSPLVAFIYMFNLIVGTGALALPSVLVGGGWYLGSLFLIIVACLSYIGVTFMIESMSAANAMLFWDGKVPDPDLQAETDLRDSEQALLLDGSSHHSPFEITKRTELGQMAEIFFSQTGRILFYIALILYLFGDAAIYCTFVPRSLVGLIYGDSPPPWAFDAFLALFVLLIVPFCFFDFQKTKPLQVATMGIRNAAVFTIIVLATLSILNSGSQTKGVPKFKLQALPNLFGGAVYAFMCHHSLPGIITPMRQKSLIPRVVNTVFVGIFVLYFLLFLSCGLAFGLTAQDPITFNFPPRLYGWVGDALFLFPVFTLSSSFPMLSITLRNNLDTLLHLIFPKAAFPGILPKYPQEAPPTDLGANLDKATRRRIMVTLLAVAPPIGFCIIAEHLGVDVSSLVGLTGAYAGAAVMFIIPACLVHCSRSATCQRFSSGVPANHPIAESHPLNIHASPFKGRKWVFMLIVMAILAIIFISYEQYSKGPAR